MIKAFGEPTEVLELVDVPEPAGPAAGEVLVGVDYAPINVNDLYVIQGAFPATGDATLKFSVLSGVAAMVETMPLERAPEAYARITSGDVRFRMVLKMEQ
jgi:D-arabinose 1-dehydrogenase-like Zn-dependent alcohol dehydrogenase